MSLLELVITAHRCRSTHHFIAIDALSLLDGKDSGLWRNLLLRHHEKLLKGAKAPDKEFKDFKNHVLHVGEGEWGGACDAAMDWYGRSVAALRAEKWGDAAYALGVLTHYYADPIQPFHTAQSEEEGAMHRALEWSIAKSRQTIEACIRERGYPIITAGTDTGFVADMVRAGAERSHPHYQTLIDHYDIHAGVKNPEAGLDETLIDIISDLVAYATAGVAVLFERAFAEAAVKPQKVDLDLPGYLAALDIPIRKITKRMAEGRDRKTVEAMYEELLETGKVIKTLPADDKAIRKLHAKQVLRKPLAEIDQQALKPLGVKHAGPHQPAPPPMVVPKRRPVEAAKPAQVPTVSAEPPALADVRKPISMPSPILKIVPDEPVSEPETEAIEDAALESVTEEAQPEPIPQPEPEPVLAEPAPTPADKVLAELDKTDIVEQSEPVLEAEPVDSSALPESSALSDDTTDKPLSKAEKTERLTRESPVVDAPSIGPKTAARLEKVNIITIGDLMDADPEETAASLDVRYIKTKTLKDWQDQTSLMLAMPGLRVLDSQILVGAGIRDAKALAGSSTRKVLNAATSFLDTPSGSRVLWGASAKVEEDEVNHWIDLARSANG